MASSVFSWLLAIPLLGVCTGARAMTPIAVACWFAHLGLLQVQGTWAAWTANIISVIVFTVLALGEFVGDKLPRTPSRLSPFPLASRVIFGGVVGAIVATGIDGSIILGAILGVIGAVIGSFGGYHVRHYLTSEKNCRDWAVAIFEDFTIILFTVFSLRLATA